MTAYAFFYNPNVYNSTDTTKSMEHPAHQVDMAQQHDYLDVYENPIAHSVLVMALYPQLYLVASSALEWLLSQQEAFLNKKLVSLTEQNVALDDKVNAETKTYQHNDIGQGGGHWTMAKQECVKGI